MRSMEASDPLAPINLGNDTRTDLVRRHCINYPTFLFALTTCWQHEGSKSLLYNVAARRENRKDHTV